ncbi:hypothetical protein [Halogeometricum borinquense]|uniref:DUF3267 domain-containing protein n=2 Tax=Halogeometricum borinquense (strain ATCC 700274 / DSM 11551 / JCM 10706 / KCTC 4070 / PR3) TaxID=469382 RepID=E4NME1_HALBP|nr:hypothetical protein [Halogeometricum borinquense]ADQ68439.1 hypothetical protein Hbor_29000 [Halogeometricum borinquense DSM 11551]
MTTTSDTDSENVGLVDLLGALVMFPAVLAHELTHAAVAWPWIEATRPLDLVDRLVPPRLELNYPAGTPVVVVVVANLAPTMVGALLTPFVVPWAFGLEVPLMTYVFGAWALYTWPSADDLAVLSALF